MRRDTRKVACDNGSREEGQVLKPVELGALGADVLLVLLRLDGLGLDVGQVLARGRVGKLALGQSDGVEVGRDGDQLGSRDGVEGKVGSIARERRGKGQERHGDDWEDRTRWWSNSKVVRLAVLCWEERGMPSLFPRIQGMAVLQYV